MRKGKDPHYDACRQLFDDLHDRKRTVVVSALVVGEVIQVTRREAARATGKEYTSKLILSTLVRNCSLRATTMLNFTFTGQTWNLSDARFL